MSGKNNLQITIGHFIRRNPYKKGIVRPNIFGAHRSRTTRTDFFQSICSDYSQPALSKKEKEKLDFYYRIFGNFLTGNDEMEKKFLKFYYLNDYQFPLFLCAAYACLKKKTGQTKQPKRSGTPQDVENVLKIMNTQTSTDRSKGNTPLLVTAKEILEVAIKFNIYPYSAYSKTDPNDLESFCMDLNLIVLKSDNLFVNVKGKYAFIRKSPEPPVYTSDIDRFNQMQRAINVTEE